MDSNNYKHIILFSIFGGFLIYILNAVWSAIFIVSVPMDKDWCKDSMQYETGINQTEWVCTEFKSELAKQKYYHNRDMQDRNQYWLYAILAFGGFLGFIAFCKMPKWRGKKEKSPDVSGPIILGILVALFVPMVYIWILPAPKKWFPSEFTEISKERQKAALEDLKLISEY